MPEHPRPTPFGAANFHRLLTYVADLELEVDRLRKQGHFIVQQVRGALRTIQGVVAAATAAGEVPPLFAPVGPTVQNLADLLRATQDSPGFHPAHDQVIPIAVRPLVEQVFRWQQLLTGAADVVLRLDLSVEHLEWFPARLRHIIDNLMADAFQHLDAAKAEIWVAVGLRVQKDHYQLELTDNGVGLSKEERQQAFDLFYRAAPARAAGLGVGLAVAKLLVEQSGGKLTVDAGAGQGTTFTALLPRYDVDDFLV